jgi:hypothetical protein
MNINFKNIYKYYNLIEKSFKNADYIAIDFEFLGIDSCVGGFNARNEIAVRL